jgi:hypothetical protein
MFPTDLDGTLKPILTRREADPRSIRLTSASNSVQVEVEMIRAFLRYFGIAIWAGLGIWFVAGLPWL